MDMVLGRFLAWVRPRARAAHLSVYEELAWQVDGFLRGRPRRATLCSATLRGFLGSWYATDAVAVEPRARQLYAALRVLAGWLGRETDPIQGRRLRAAVARQARDVVRVARVAELLEGHTERGRGFGPVFGRNATWEVVLQGNEHVVVRQVGAVPLVGPVLLPAPVVRRLRPGTVLDLQLVSESDHWRVVDHGPCYPSLAWLAARRAAVSVPV